MAIFLDKGTSKDVDGDASSHNKRKQIQHSIMNVVEKYLPTLDSNGDRALDKVKARQFVDRSEYRQEEIESPTDRLDCCCRRKIRNGGRRCVSIFECTHA
jgi:hypothetical protein